MTKLTLVLVLLSVTLIASARHRDINQQSQYTMPINQNLDTLIMDTTLIVEGKIVEKPYLSMARQKVYLPNGELVKDFFLEIEDKKYFIKIKSSRVEESELKKYINCVLKFKIKTYEYGLWDTSDPMISSRVGEYITIQEIIK